MQRLYAALAVLTSLLVSSPATWADPGYRLIEIVDTDDADLQVNDLNNRGEVVGSRLLPGGRHAFHWRNGQLTDLHDVIAPKAIATGAAAINDWSTIIGTTTSPELPAFRLRGTQVTPLTIVPGETNVIASDINNRGQIIGSSFGGALEGSFFLDGTHVEQLPGLPNGSSEMAPRALNNRGAMVGYADSGSGPHAVLWRAGVLTDLGLADRATSSVGSDVNERLQVVGGMTIDRRGVAFSWQDGRIVLLAPVVPGAEQDNGASSINDWGVIVGGTILRRQPSPFVATLWFRGRAIDIDTLIRNDDPLKPFVHLISADKINNRGDIVATGFDSRSPDASSSVYFLTLFDP
jgi:probable HAF family extracellular repeat protein